MLCGKRVVPDSCRTLPPPFLMSICLIAISSEFLEIDLPNPLPSAVVTEDFTGLRIAAFEVTEVLRCSCMSDA